MRAGLQDVKVPEVAEVAGPGRRTRRRPEVAEAEILDAARAVLAERPAHEVTVWRIMERTTLSRKSFYGYFKDRHELLTRLLEPLREERDEILTPIERGADLMTAGHAVLLGLARFYAAHGRLLRALARASDEDSESGQAWRDFLEPVVTGHLRLVEEEMAAGRISGIDPEPTVRALIAMNLQYFFDELVDRPDGDVDRVARTLARIWGRALYGR